MLVKDIIQRIQSLYSRGVQSDDSRLSSRLIYNKMLSVRMRLVSQKANKKQEISQQSYQTLPCIELIKASSHECPCLPPVGCSFLRSKHKIPTIAKSIYSSLLNSVTSIEGTTNFSYSTWEDIPYTSANKYTGKRPRYFFKDDYLYILSEVPLKVVTIPGAIFEDPYEAEKFKSFCEDCEECQSCIDPLEMEFPIDGDLIEVLIEFCKAELVQEFSQRTQDRGNSARDDIQEQEQTQRNE